jgi:hypothetical protein
MKELLKLMPVNGLTVDLAATKMIGTAFASYTVAKVHRAKGR